MENCKEQLFDGTHCQNKKVHEGFCFWHSGLLKNDANVKRFHPEFSSLKEAIEKGGLNFEKAIFSRADLQNINLSNLVFKGANFDRANLSGTRCTNSDLQSALFVESLLTATNFCASNMSKAGFTRCNIKDANFTDTVLNMTRFYDCDLSFTDFANVKFHSTKFTFVNLYKAKFSNNFFSKKESQLKYCNIKLPEMDEYFINIVFDWIKENNNVDILKVIEFYRKKFPDSFFKKWLNNIISSLKESYERNTRKKDFLMMADILETVSKIYKIINDISFNRLLPASSIKNLTGSGSSYLKIKSDLLHNQISTKNFNRLSLDIHLLLDSFNSINGDKNRHSNKIISLSLHSPLEIILYTSPLIISALFKVIDMYLKMRLNIEELAIKKIDRKLKLIELQSKVNKEFPNISKQQSKKIIPIVHKHYHFINREKEFENYELSNDKVKKILKTTPDNLLKRSPKRIKNKKNT